MVEWNGLEYLQLGGGGACGGGHLAAAASAAAETLSDDSVVAWPRGVDALLGGRF